MSEPASALINSYVAIPETIQPYLFQSVQEELTRRVGINTNNHTTQTIDQVTITNNANSVAHHDRLSHSNTSTAQGHPNNDAVSVQHNPTRQVGDTSQQDNPNNDDTSSVDDNNEELTTIEQEIYVNNKHVGPKIDSAKEDDTFRVYFCNVNGLKLERECGDYAEFRLEMEKLQTDINKSGLLSTSCTRHCTHYNKEAFRVWKIVDWELHGTG